MKIELVDNEELRKSDLGIDSRVGAKTLRSRRQRQNAKHKVK